MYKTGIALFVYNRPQHAQKVLDGLKKNHIQKLYIFSDGPKNSEDAIQVLKVRDLIKKIDWCQTEIIEHDQNKGLAASLFFGFAHIFHHYEQMIAIEDDCIPSADYIDFMEQCLNKYAHEKIVMSITGYTLPIKIPKKYQYDVFFTIRSGSHGFATWKRAWNMYERNSEDFQAICVSPELRQNLDAAGRDLFYMFDQQIKGQIDSFHVWWSWCVVKNKGVCINPVRSRIQDVGRDGTGTHCGKERKFWITISKETILQPLKFPERIELNKTINSRFSKFEHGSLFERGKIRLEDAMKRLLRRCHL